MMHNYFDNPIDTRSDKALHELFLFGYNGEWYNLSQAILWLGNRLRNSQGDYIILYHTDFKEHGATLTEGDNLFNDFFLDLTPTEFESFGYLYAYNQDKDETYIVKGDGVQAVEGKYIFYKEKGKVLL